MPPLRMRFLSICCAVLAASSALAPAQSPPAAHYRLEKQKLVRWVGDVRQVLGCTLEEGPGEVRGYARSPMGNVYVAAERGVFVVDDRSSHLDPLPLWEGAPRGPVVGVAVPNHRRLWYATADAVAVVDTHQFFGQTLGEADGLPPPPYKKLRARPDGAIVLVTKAGKHVIARSRKPGAEIELARVAGRAYEAGATIELENRDAELALTIAGDPRALLFWRDARHANWYPLDRAAPRLENIEPGEHELVLAAFDSHLVQSRPVAVRVSVPYPPALEPRTALPIAVGAALAIAFAFALVQWRRPPAQRAWRRAAVSAALVIVLATQLGAALFPHARGWPFIGFAMYTHTVAPFSHSYRDVLVGVPPREPRFEVDIWAFGMGQFEFRRRLVPAIHGGEAERRALLDELNERFYEDDLPRYDVLVERYRLSERGPIRVAPLELATYERDEPHEETESSDGR